MSIGTLAPPLEAAALARPAQGSRVWRKLVRNPATLAGAIILVIVIGAAVFAPWVAPQDPTRQSLIRRLSRRCGRKAARPSTCSAPIRSGATS